MLIEHLEGIHDHGLVIICNSPTNEVIKFTIIQNTVNLQPLKAESREKVPIFSTSLDVMNIGELKV